MKEPRQRIAYIIPGGIGTGKLDIGVPVLERVIRIVAANNDVTVFQLYPRNKGYDAGDLEVIDICSGNGFIKTLKFLIAFQRLHRKRRFHAAHGFWALPGGFLATLAGKIFGVRSVVSLQGGDAISLPHIGYGQLQKWSSRKVVLWTLHRADVVISPTRYLVSNLRKFGFTREQIEYIPLGVDTDEFVFRERPQKEPITFLHVATLSPVKDQETLLRAFRIINEKVLCRLMIVGEGPLEGRIRSLAQELQIAEKITFTGLLPYESLPACYDAADILLHTSLSEGHPIAVEEAMSCGVIVCGTNVGLLFDLPDCCVSVPVGAYGQLAEETLTLISDPQRMDAIRQSALKWARAHTMAWTVERVAECYRA